jgi:tRNA-dihydrouridine synthase 2
MVRVGALPFRALALKYGFDYVWTEEIIDRKLTAALRVYNTELETWDFRVDNAVVLRIDPKIESGKVVLQIGSCTPASALEAARKVEDLVAAIDINMGCPKTFSVHGGMGACLLSNVDLAASIISTLATNLSVPVMAKIRLLDTTEKTIVFIQALEAAGCSAVTVHLRQRSVESTVPAASWQVMKQLVDALKIPLIANGDLYSRPAVREMLDKSSCHAVMIARPALLNASILRREEDGGPLPQLQVIYDYLSECTRYKPLHQNVKYTIMEVHFFLSLLDHHKNAFLYVTVLIPHTDDGG